MALLIEVISEVARFAAIRPQWDALWMLCQGEIFQDHVWIAAWFDAWAGRVTPRIAVAWDGREIVAAVPLAIRRRAGLRLLEWSAQTLSDYCDALAIPGKERHLLQLWDALWQTGGFDLVNLTQIRPNALVRACLDEDGTGHTKTARRDRKERCFSIDCVWPDGEAWFRSLGKKGRNNFWRGERILVDLGGEIAFHSLDPTKQSITQELQQTLELKRSWLKETNRSSSLLGDDGKALEAMIHAVSDRGLLRLFLLTCGDKIAAASVNFVHSDRMMQAYLTSYAPEFERASPGMILIVRYTRWAFDNGLKKVDFLRGDEPFKQRLANAEVDLASYLGARTPIGRAALTVHAWMASSTRKAEDAAPTTTIGRLATGS